MHRYKQTQEVLGKGETASGEVDYARDWNDGVDFVGQQALRSETDAELSTTSSAAQEKVHTNWQAGQLAEVPAIEIPSSFQVPLAGNARSTYTPFGDESQDTSLRHILGSDLFRGVLDGEYPDGDSTIQLEPVPYPVMEVPSNSAQDSPHGNPNGLHLHGDPGYGHHAAFAGGIAASQDMNANQLPFNTSTGLGAGAFQPLHSSFYSAPHTANWDSSADVSFAGQSSFQQSGLVLQQPNGFHAVSTRDAKQGSEQSKSTTIRDQPKKTLSAERRSKTDHVGAGKSAAPVSKGVNRRGYVEQASATASSDKDGSSQERKSDDSATNASTAPTSIPVSGSVASLDGSNSSNCESGAKDFKEKADAVGTEGDAIVDDAALQGALPDANTPKQAQKKKKKTKKSKSDGKDCESEDGSPHLAAAAGAAAIPAMPMGTNIEEMGPVTDQEPSYSKKMLSTDSEIAAADQEPGIWGATAIQFVLGMFGQSPAKAAMVEKVSQKGNDGSKSVKLPESGKAAKKQKFYAARKAATATQSQDDEDLDEETSKAKRGGTGTKGNLLRDILRMAKGYIASFTKSGSRKRSKGRGKSIFSMRTAVLLFAVWVILITTPGSEGPDVVSTCYGTSETLNDYCPWGLSWSCSIMFPRIEMLCVHLEWVGMVLTSWGRLWSSIGRAVWLPVVFYDRMGGSSSRASLHRGRVTHCSLLPLQHHCALGGHGHYDRLRWHLDTVLHILELERAGSFGPDGRCVGERCISLSISSWVAGFRRPIGAYTLLCKQQFGEGSEFDGEMCACRLGYVVKGGVCRISAGTDDKALSSEDEPTTLEPKFKGRKLTAASKSDAKCAKNGKGKKPRVKTVRKSSEA